MLEDVSIFPQKYALFTDLDTAKHCYHMICSVQFYLLIFIKEAQVGPNQHFICVNIPWHKPIILTENNKG